jgi:hypothetical protein
MYRSLRGRLCEAQKEVKALKAELLALREVVWEVVNDMAPSEAYVYYTPQREALRAALVKAPKSTDPANNNAG